MSVKTPTLALLFFLAFLNAGAQNENTKWYFGNHAGLDFMTNPPTVLNNSAMGLNSSGHLEGCSAVANASGNLLFYTDGSTIYNQLHTPMANGSGLFGGGGSSTQSGFILKKPGSANLYYIFSNDAGSGAQSKGLFYSVVDISLAAGMGSVTVKNATVIPGAYSTSEQLSAVRHFNGTDYWMMVHELGNNNYRAYLLTAAGINTATPVISSVGSVMGQFSTLKFSPAGKMAAIEQVANFLEIYDFDNATGIVSNSFSISVNGFPYGVEFSPDGTKLYCARGATYTNSLIQWDLGMGSNIAISSSSIAIATSTLYGGLQLAPNGKIYVASRFNTPSISVINNPNAPGIGCNFVNNGQNVSALVNGTLSTSSLGLPQMIATCYTAVTVLSNSIECNGMATGSASVVNPYISAYLWSNGLVTYTTPTAGNLSAGQWTVSLTGISGCSSSTVLTISQPPAVTLNISSSNPSACVNTNFTLSASAAGGTGGFSYTWNNSNITGMLFTASQNTQGVYTYTATATDGNNCTSGNSFMQVVDLCAGIGQLETDITVKVYPNPNNGKFVVEVDCETEIVVYNYSGAVVLKHLLAVGKNNIDLSNHGDGIYIIHFKQKTGHVIQKMIQL